MKAGLPEGTELAHRTGISGRNEDNLRGAMNDVGIFKLPNGKHIILSIYLKNITEEREDTEKIIADLTKATWNYFTRSITKEFLKSEIKLDTLTFFDRNRNRNIPIAIYQPKDKNKSNNIPILFSHGYGGNNGSDYLDGYTYLTEFLASQGYFVVSIQHELKSDEPLAMHGVLKETRMPSWERGVLNMQFVLQEIKKKYPELKFDELALIGHSQGGDMVALFAQKHPEIVKKIITMDNRRMKLPLLSKPIIFTLRSNDFPADEGVLPTNEEKEKYNITVQYTNINHSSMDNDASETERIYLQTKILEYLKNSPQ
jgi:predicted esterase